jgi:hypothetical protein
VCKQWYQVINNEKRLMNRYIMKIAPESYPDFTDSHPEIVPKFTNLKLVRLHFAEPLSEYFLALFGAVQNIKFLKCRVNQQHLMVLFETIFGAINSFQPHQIRSVDQIELDDFSVLPTTYEGSGVKRMKLQHMETSMSPPIVKNLKMRITDVKPAMEFFERLKDMNVTVQRLEIYFHDERNKDFNYGMFNQLLDLFHEHYQHLIKELTIDLRHNGFNLDRFYGRLSAMRDLRLESLRLKGNNVAWVGGVFKVFIRNQVALRTLEVKKELTQEIVDIMKSVLPEMKNLELGFASRENHVAFWSNFPITSNLEILKFNVDTRMPFDVEIDFAKVPNLGVLEIRKAYRFNIYLAEQSILVFTNLNQQMANMKKLLIDSIRIDDQHFKQIFENMPNLTELHFRKEPVSSIGSFCFNKFSIK